MAQENIILKVVYDTSEAVPSAKGLEKVMNSTTKATNELNSSLNNTQKELSQFDKNVKGGADGLKTLAQAKKNFTDISLIQNTKEFKDLNTEIQNALLTDKEFLKVANEVAEKVKNGTMQNAEAFDVLEKAINKGVQATALLNKRTTDAVNETNSFKAEMSDLQSQITNGELKGDDLEIAIKRLAEMKAQSKDLKEKVNLLGSDTRTLTTLMAGLRVGVGAFAALQGASALFGTENKRVQEALLKVTGAMALLQGLEEIQNGLKKNGIFLTGLQTIATNTYAFSLRVVTAIQTAFGVSSATAWAIATAGVTLLITAIGLLIYNYKEVTRYVTDFLGITTQLTEQQKLQKQYADDINNVQKELIDNNTKEIANVIKLSIAIKDQNLSRKERLKALEQYNEIADKGNKIDAKQIDNGKLIEATLQRQTNLIIKKALAESANNELMKIGQDLIAVELKLAKENSTIRDKAKLTEEERLKSLAKTYNVLNGLNSTDFQTQEQTITYLKQKDVLEQASALKLQKQAEEYRNRMKNIIEMFGIADVKEKEVKEVKVKVNKVEVDPKDIQLKNNRASLLNLSVLPKLLGEAITQLPLKEFSLSIPVMPEINIDKTLESIQGIQQAFESTASKSSQFGGLFSSIAGVTTSAFNVKELKNALAEQRIAIEFGKKQLALTTDEYNQKLKESEKQIEEALKTGNQERIKQAKETSEKLKEEYKKNIEDQKNAIKNAEENAQTLGEKLKAGVGDIVKGSLRVIGEVNNLIGASIDRNIARLDGLIEKQKVAVQDAKNIADKGNALQYEAEIKKQQKLEELRRQEAKKKKAIAISEIIINNAIGITDIWSKWASNPAVAGVLTGLLVALTGVQIGVVATQQFKKGGKVPTGMQKGASHEQGGIKFGVKGRNELYEFEGDEFIFNKETSLKNQKWFDKINRENLSLDELLGNRIKPMGLNPILSSTYVNQNGQLERRLIKVEQAILDLPERMPQTSFNADSRGLSMTMKRIIDKENSWKR